MRTFIPVGERHNVMHREETSNVSRRSWEIHLGQSPPASTSDLQASWLNNYTISDIACVTTLQVASAYRIPVSKSRAQHDQLKMFNNSEEHDFGSHVMVASKEFLQCLAFGLIIRIGSFKSHIIFAANQILNKKRILHFWRLLLYRCFSTCNVSRTNARSLLTSPLCWMSITKESEDRLYSSI